MFCISQIYSYFKRLSLALAHWNCCVTLWYVTHCHATLRVVAVPYVTLHYIYYVTHCYITVRFSAVPTLSYAVIRHANRMVRMPF